MKKYIYSLIMFSMIITVIVQFIQTNIPAAVGWLVAILWFIDADVLRKENSILFERLHNSTDLIEKLVNK